MIQKTVTIENMDGTTETQTLYFNLTRAELIRMEMSEEGGLSKKLEQLQANGTDIKGIIEAFEYILGSAYGEKSEDGKKFIKNKTIAQAFISSEAYSAIFEEFLADTTKASSFISSLAPNTDKLLNKTPEQIRADSLAAKGGYNQKAQTSSEVETVSEDPNALRLAESADQLNSVRDPDYQAYLDWKASQAQQ